MSTRPLGTETRGPLQAALASFTGGFVSRIMLQPMDVVKIRLQIDPARRIRLGGVYRTVINVFRNEGILAFWKGHLTSQMLTASFVVTQFEAYEGMNTLLTHVEAKHNDHQKLVKMNWNLGLRKTICREPII
ncbi:hypothetical protein ACOME3_010282 [Neoechinorhynchus agilis]